MNNRDLPVRSPRAIAFLVAGTFFIELLDATIITTALPYMAADFGVAPTSLTVGISTYLLSIAVFVPLSGWITDRLGARRTFTGAIVIFTLASLLCGLSTSLWMFVAARVIQGVGGALMVPVGRLLVLRNSKKKDLITLVAIITWPGLAAPILGPPLGGLISQTWSWHWIFFINVPLGAIALGASLYLVHGRKTRHAPFDWPGFAYAATSLIALIVAMEYVAHGRANYAIVTGLLLTCALTSWLGVKHLRRAEHPLFALDVLEVRTFMVGMRGGSLFRITIGAVPLLLPLMYQIGFGFDGFTAGLYLLALFAGNLGIKPATTWLLRKFGFYTILVTNGSLVALGFALMALLQKDTAVWLAIPLIVFSGACRSMQFTALNTGSLVDVEPEHMTDANTLSSLVFQVNATLGIGLAALTVSISAAITQGDANAPGVIDFHIAFIILAVLAAIGTLDLMRLPRTMGREVSGHARAK
ncbi:MFS transporter [Micrococcales bacterium 31B]|nr:MFS transporter [Micrococcales bacterium 31B]